MSSSARTPKPEAPPSEAPMSDADIADERSAIRPRVEPRRPVSPSLDRAAREQRIEQLVRMAKVLLSDLPADHPRARILRSAVIRRDEVLLEGVLNGHGAPTERSGRR